MRSLAIQLPPIRLSAMRLPADTHSCTESVSTCARYTFGHESVSLRDRCGGGFSPEGALPRLRRTESPLRRHFSAGRCATAGISSKVSPPASISRREARCRSNHVQRKPSGVRISPEGSFLQAATPSSQRRRRDRALALCSLARNHQLRGMLGVRDGLGEVAVGVVIRDDKVEVIHG